MTTKYKCPKCGAEGFYCFLEVPVTMGDDGRIIEVGTEPEDYDSGTSAMCSKGGMACYEGIMGDFAYDDEPKPEAPKVARDDLMEVIARAAAEMRNMLDAVTRYFDHKD